MPVRPATRTLSLAAFAAVALLAVGIPALGASESDPPASPAAAAAAAVPADPASQSTPIFSVNPAPACKDPMCYWAQSTIYSNTRTHIHMVMTNPEIVDTTRGISHITADHGVADGPDIADSEWTFTGHVHADTADGQLRADTATVQVVDRQIASITAQGNPALFQRLPDNPLVAAGDGAAPAVPAAPSVTQTLAPKSSLASLTVHGHAQSITYDATHDQVQFTGDSWFTDGCNDITSELVTYEMASQTVRAGETPGSRARVHGTIRNTRPGNVAGCTAGTGAGAAPAGAPAASPSARAPSGARRTNSNATSTPGASEPGTP